MNNTSKNTSVDIGDGFDPNYGIPEIPKRKVSKKKPGPRSIHLPRLKEMAFKAHRIKYPSMPEYAVTVHKYTDKNANGLTRCIIDLINFSGYQAERISNMGRYIDNTEIVTDVVGFQKKIGSGQYVPGTGTNGTADISATIKGMSVKIEVKIKDKQSEDQVKYQLHIEKAGGVYIIAKNFDSFYEWFIKFTSC